MTEQESIRNTMKHFFNMPLVSFWSWFRISKREPSIEDGDPEINSG